MHLFYFLSALFVSRFPLLNILGYETSAIFGVLAAIVVLLCVEVPYKDEDLWMWWLNESLRQLSALNVSIVVYVLNSLIVPNCDWQIGIQFWILIPCVTVLTTVGAIGVLSRMRIGKPRWLIFTVFLIDALLLLWRLAWWPAIDGYSISFGWFAGSIYDEAISISGELIRYRLHLLFLTATVVMMFSALSSVKNFKILALVLCQWLMIEKFPEPILLRNSNWVQNELGRTVESEHFIVHFSPLRIDARQEHNLLQDLEFRYWELQHIFNEDPVVWKGRKIEVFVYPDTETQQRLMGARNTFVARPWTHQIHIRWEYGQSVLAHELSHIFSAKFGGWLLGLPTYENGIPNIGLLEGLAVAADWPVDRFTPHQVSAALYQNEQLPNLRTSFDPAGFWKSPAGKAYQGVGSFVKWMLDTYGIEKIKLWYQGFEFYNVFSIELFEAIEQWELFLRGYDIKKSNEIQILKMYSRKSIFQKVCARTIAEQKRQVAHCLRNRKYAEANTELDRLLTWTNSPYFHYLKVKNTIKINNIDPNEIRGSIDFDESSRYFPNWMAIWIDSLTSQKRFYEAEQLALTMSDMPISDSWKRQFLVRFEFARQRVPPTYFDDELRVIDRIGWLNSGVLTDPIRSYLLAVNWFVAHQFQQVLGIPIDETLPEPLQENLAKMHFLASMQLEDVQNAERALEYLKQHVLFEEYTLRLQFLKHTSLP